MKKIGLICISLILGVAVYNTPILLAQSLDKISEELEQEGTAKKEDEKIQGEQQPTWLPFEEGIALAKEQGKDIIIDFYTDWCSWCKVMDEKTFSDPQVAAYMKEHYIAIRLDAESTSETIHFKGQTWTPRELTYAFQIQGFPSYGFLNKDAEVITVIPGYIEKDTFLKILEYMHKKCYEEGIDINKYIKGEVDCTEE